MQDIFPSIGWNAPVGAIACFKGGKTPKVPAPLPPPAITTAADNAGKAYREDQRRRGINTSSTILGSSPDIPTGKKTLLGQ